MHTAIKTAFIASLMIGGASGASAQSLNPSLNPGESETRILAAITVPLGHARDRASTAPRVELISRSRATDGVLPVVARDEQRRWQERRIGFTLDGSDQLMINGRAMQWDDGENRDGISTLGAVGIGLGLLTALSIAVITDSKDALTDLVEPD
ncbi:hypothetical protein [Erythrobacter sp. Alg231-14]|uniref:hypothetical protein n=1 Tax=Erythrobacter sp. Alg231-14 TaxID=1922225 RepID=UPI000D55B373